MTPEEEAAAAAPALDAHEITEGLWQGAAPPAGDALERLGFTVLFLCANDHQPPSGSHTGLRGYRVGLRDDGTPPTAKEIESAALAGRKVAELMAAGDKVLVTCQMGLNRSGLVCALALYFSQEISGAQAMMKVQIRRPGALQNPWFQSILRQLPKERPCTS